MSDGMPYAEFCEYVMNDDSGELIKNFRRHPDYDLVVPGNRDGKGVMEFLNIIKKEYPGMLQYMDDFEKQQGEFGNPTTYEYDIGTFDSVLILYMYYLALTMDYFGNLNGMKICEIGPGAGLFFKLLTDIHYGIKYIFVDLEGPLFINRKHVEYLGREDCVMNYLPCSTVMSENIDYKLDLVVSDCAFNELHKDVQEVYIEKLLNKSVRGRVAFYDADINAVLPSLGIMDTFKRLDKKSKIIKMDLRVPTLYWDESKEK